jgi:hypothetical protein
MRTIRVVCAFVCFLLAASSARAQFETAAVIGTVRDTSGAVVADATLTLMSPGTGVSVKRTSGPDGAYEFVTVKPGVYVVSAEKPGLAMALVENVQVQVGSRARVDLTMTVGQVAERVEVTAASPLLESENSQRGQVVTGSQIRELR